MYTIYNSTSHARLERASGPGLVVNLIYNITMQLKLPLSFHDQLEKLLTRGMIVSDIKSAEEFLQTHNYYHLNKYFHEFMDSDGNYIQGTTFEYIESIYENDAWLRNHLFYLIEPFELKVKTIVANYISLKYGSEVFYKYEIYQDINAWQSTMNIVLREVKRDTTNPVVLWHLKQYDGKFPMWVLIEFFTLGSFSHYFGNLNSKDKNEIANFYHVSGYLLKSWLNSISLLRNLCAHTGQLFRRIYTSPPYLPNFLGWPSKDNRHLFAIMLVLRRLSTLADWQSFADALDQRDTNAPFLIDYGFPQNWRDYLM